MWEWVRGLSTEGLLCVLVLMMLAAGVLSAIATRMELHNAKERLAAIEAKLGLVPKMQRPEAERPQGVATERPDSR